MAARLRNSDRNLDSDSTLDDSRELRIRNRNALHDSADPSLRGQDSFEDSNADGTVRIQGQPQAVPRNQLNQVPYSSNNFI